MNMRGIIGVSTAASLAALLSGGAAQAAMSPDIHHQAAGVQRVDCAVGFHIGPAGACILGDEEHRDHDKVIERRATNEGCETKTVRRSDDMGDSETHTKTDCD